VLPGCLLGASWVFLGSQDASRWVKITKYHKIHNIHVPKVQGVLFFEVAEAPQAAATQTQRAGRPLGHDGTLQIYNNLENNMFLNKWNLTCKTQVKSHVLPKT